MVESSARSHADRFPRGSARVFWTTLATLLLPAALLAGAAALAPVSAAEAEAAGTANAAEAPAAKALFSTPHLANITHPVTLTYAFTRQGPDGFTDIVREDIKIIHPDGTKYVMFNFLSGDHHVFYPALDGYRGNPVFMVFLEHDVNEMRDETGIAAAWYRNRIRAAFLDGAEVKQEKVNLDGREVPATLVTLTPFKGEERFAQLPQIAAKSYRFVLSDAVPGGILEIAAEMPALPDQGLPARGERLVFQGVKDDPPEAAPTETAPQEAAPKGTTP
jgi:hypothetical protein